MTATGLTPDSASEVLMVRGVFRLPLRVGRRPVQQAVHHTSYPFDGVATSGATVTDASFTREAAVTAAPVEGTATLREISAVTITPHASIIEGQCAVATLVHVRIDWPRLVFSSAGLDEWVVVVEGVGIAQVLESPPA